MPSCDPVWRKTSFERCQKSREEADDKDQVCLLDVEQLLGQDSLEKAYNTNQLALEPVSIALHSC